MQSPFNSTTLVYNGHVRAFACISTVWLRMYGESKKKSSTKDLLTDQNALVCMIRRSIKLADISMTNTHWKDPDECLPLRLGGIAYRYLLVVAVGRRERNAVEVHAVVAVGDGRQVEHHHQDDEQDDSEQQTHSDPYEPSGVGNNRATNFQVGAETEGHEYPEQQAEQMGEVVDVGKHHAEEEEYAEHNEQLGDCHARGAVLFPAQHLDEYDGEDGELGPGRTGLGHTTTTLFAHRLLRYDGREGPSLLCGEFGNATERCAMRWSDVLCDGAMCYAMERCAMRWSDARCDGAMCYAMERCTMRWSDVLCDGAMRYAMERCAMRWSDARCDAMERWASFHLIAHYSIVRPEQYTTSRYDMYRDTEVTMRYISRYRLH